MQFDHPDLVLSDNDLPLLKNRRGIKKMRYVRDRKIGKAGKIVEMFAMLRRSKEGIWPTTDHCRYFASSIAGKWRQARVDR